MGDVTSNDGAINAISNPLATRSASGGPSKNCFGPIVEIGEPINATIDLRVCAGADTDNSPAATIAGRAAYGVRSGAGNDTVINAGEITATLGSSVGAGVAIDTGAGEDTVSLLDGSITRGAVKALKKGTEWLDLGALGDEP